MNLKLVIVLFFSLLSFTGFSQCNDALLDSCKTQLGETTYLKHFKVRFSKSSGKRKPSVANFSVYLNKGTTYKFTTANDKKQKGRAIIKLYDDFRLYGSNLNKATDSIAPAFDFVCKKTGIYYLTIRFNKGEAGCAAVMLSMKKRKKKYENRISKPENF